MIAGDFYEIISAAIVLPILIFFLIVVAPTIPGTAYVAPPEIILMLLGIPEIVVLMLACMGYNGRRNEHSLREELRRS